MLAASRKRHRIGFLVSRDICREQSRAGRKRWRAAQRLMLDVNVAVLRCCVCPRSDMTSMIWDSSLEDSVVAKYEDHTEFVLGQAATHT